MCGYNDGLVPVCLCSQVAIPNQEMMMPVGTDMFGGMFFCNMMSSMAAMANSVNQQMVSE